MPSTSIPKYYDIELFHWVGEEDVLTGRHTDWLNGETLTSVVAVSSNSLRVEVDSPGTVNTEVATILGLPTAIGEASFVLYRVVGGKRGQKEEITVTLSCTDANRTDIVKALVNILG